MSEQRTGQLAIATAVLALLSTDCSPTYCDLPLPQRYPKLGIPTKNGDADLSSVRVDLEQDGCFGRCPQYHVTVHGTGTGEYDGKGFVLTTGRVDFSCQPSALLPILDALEAVDFMGEKMACDGDVADVPHAEVTLSIAGRSSSFWFLRPPWPCGITDPKHGKLLDACVQVAESIEALAGTSKLVGTLEERREAQRR